MCGDYRVFCDDFVCVLVIEYLVITLCVLLIGYLVMTLCVCWLLVIW